MIVSAAPTTGSAAATDAIPNVTITSKRQTIPLLNRGDNLSAALPNMKEERLELLMKAFDASVRGHALFPEVFGVI